MKMEVLKTVFVVNLCLLLVTSCGGGGGSSSENNQVLIFSPEKIERTADEGDAIEFTVYAEPKDASQFTGDVYVVIEDPIGVIKSDIEVHQKEQGYEVTFNSNPALATGVHSGSINVFLCKDVNCNSQYFGSPDHFPYELTIKEVTSNLKDLVPIENALGWQTHQGNSKHTGYVPVTLNPANFTRRWTWRSPKEGQYVSPMVAEDGIVYVSGFNPFTGYDVASLYAIDETAGDLSWVHEFGYLYMLNYPAVADDKVFIATSGHEQTAMWGFDAKSGEQLFSTPFDSQWERYLAPTVLDGAVYTNGGWGGGINSFNSADGSNRWFTQLGQVDYWTPAVDEDYVYAFMPEAFSENLINGNIYHHAGLQIMDKDSGLILASIEPPYSDNHNGGDFIPTSPLVGSQNNVICATSDLEFPGYKNKLVSYDVSSLGTNWQIDGSYINPIALANNRIYVPNYENSELEVRDETTGELLWTWIVPENDTSKILSNVVVTNNLVFLSTQINAYAIDVNTKKTVWSFWKPGVLAISDSGVLYILTTDGKSLIAFNLR